MALAHSSKVVTDGLVFAIDTENSKSYKGPVMSNIANQITQLGISTSSGYSFTGSTETVVIPTVGTVVSKVNSGFNNYPAVSTQCCPAQFTYGNINVLPSTLYTYSILYKTSSGYNHPNFMYRYEYNSGGTYLTEQGIHSSTNRIHLGDGWYWAWGTFTTQSTTSYILTYHVYYKYGTVVDNLYVAKALIVQGDYTQLHPRYWPDINASRSSSSSLLDQRNSYSIDMSNMSFSSNGATFFDGVNDYIQTSQTWNDMKGASWNGFITLEGFIKTVQTPTNSAMGYFGFNSPSAYFKFMNTGNLFLDAGSTVPSRIITNCITTFSNYYNTWLHICAVYDGTVKTYYNGVLQTTSDPFTLSDISSVNFSAGSGMGYYNFQGNINNIKVYNRALTGTEVQQNFNALRRRYGL